MTARLTLVPGHLRLDDVRAALHGPVSVTLDASAREMISKSHAVVQSVAEGDKAVYGINTGFGLLASRRIDRAQLDQLQTNLVLSHAAGTGALLSDHVVRLIVLLKINGLARGYSGVSFELVEALVKLLNAGACPCIPEQGSVGASGDLAPLAHMSAALIGTGRIRLKGRELPAMEALAEAGIAPLKLGAKEGLALLNGTQVSTALALCHGLRILDLCKAATVTSALSVDAIKGSDTPLDPRLHELRGHSGQARVAEAMRALLAGSEIRRSHLQCDRVQDPYSIRCQPQVTGAALDLVKVAIERLAVEANAVTDNPLVFPDTGEVLSGGNFHAEPVAMAADMLAIAAAEVGAIAERRIALLIDPHLSGLPAFLVQDSGLNSGFMLAQVTAAALASENKSLAHPASVDSLPTSANQEDHVSMATFAARRLGAVAENVTGILAIEWLAAAQGIDFHKPLKTSAPLQEAVTLLRQRVKFYEQDRFFADDIAAARELIAGGALQSVFDKHVDSWHEPD